MLNIHSIHFQTFELRTHVIGTLKSSRYLLPCFNPFSQPIFSAVSMERLRTSKAKLKSFGIFTIDICLFLSSDVNFESLSPFRLSIAFNGPSMTMPCLMCTILLTLTSSSSKSEGSF